MASVQEIKLSPHARERLNQRKDADVIYNTQNLIRSSVKWYDKNDLIHDCALYRHCCYTTRLSKQVGYITDGSIEVLYNKGSHVAITVLEVKDKFKPITQFLKPEVLEKIKNKKIKKGEIQMNNVCKDCGKERETNSEGICEKCARRKVNMKSRGKKYVRYLDLSEKEQQRIDKAIAGQQKRHKQETSSLKIEASKIEKKNIFPLSNDSNEFIKILKDYDCEISNENLNNILNVLINTDHFKEVFNIISKNDTQKTMLDLEEVLNNIEKKLQRDWEINGFQDVDDKKFKNFLTWRRTLKNSIFFWKKLYQMNIVSEMQKIWNIGNNNLKRFQITTESISTIFNTRRPFTRVFYASDKDTAYNMFKQWMTDRNLHEDPSKTIITELTDIVGRE